MSVIAQPFICDGPGCGKRRETDTNHWFLLWEWTWDMLPNHPGPSGVALLPWTSDEEALKPGRKHACGVACALKLLERALTLGTLDFAVALQQAAKEVKH